jgi:hypothetical protein
VTRNTTELRTLGEKLASGSLLDMHVPPTQELQPGKRKKKENKIGIRISAGYARASYAGIAAWQGLGFRGISV